MMNHNKKIAVLGSTGSVGTQALDVVKQENLKVSILTAGRDYITMEKQAREFKPEFCILDDKDAADTLRVALSDTDVKVLCGVDGLKYALGCTESDVAVNAVSGAAGLIPTMEILKTNSRLALANKESLVMAGDIIMKLARERNKAILPVDSEHCAIFQCLEGSGHNAFKSLLITASGGPFWGYSKEQLEEITVERALAHPTWKMGKKITIDSATLMNKGFEVIEAARLYNANADNIKVVIHRESIIHSMVEYADNSIIAQLSVPDMRLCVQYAVNYPDRFEAVIPQLDLAKITTLNFGKPDLDAFPLLGMAYDCLREGEALPAVLNAANEVAVSAFLNKKIGFFDIVRCVQCIVEKMSGTTSAEDIDTILHFDAVARQYAAEFVDNLAQ